MRVGEALQEYALPERSLHEWALWQVEWVYTRGFCVGRSGSLHK